MSNSSNLVERALLLADRGWSIFPVHGIDDDGGGSQCVCDQGALCPSPGKHPMLSGWRRRATCNPYIVERMFRRFPDANIGLTTGPGSGLLVLDFDPRHGSEASTARLEQERGVLPPTLTAATGGGGTHRFYQWPVGRLVGNSLPLLAEYDGIDVRGKGGYVVAPPSRHASGGVYDWVDLDVPVAPLPSWLLVGTKTDFGSAPPVEHMNPWVWAAVTSECERVACAKPGTRNTELFGSARRLGQLLAGGAVEEVPVWELLQEAGESTGLLASEVERTIANGLKVGAEKPRTAPTPMGSPEEARKWLGSYRTLVHSRPWPGRRGDRQLIVLEGLIRMGMSAGRVSVSAGIRRMTIESGLSSTNAITRATQELIEDGWISCTFKGDGLFPSRWRLLIPRELRSQASSPFHTNDDGTLWPRRDVVPPLQHPHSPVGHDVFRDVVNPWIESDGLGGVHLVTAGRPGGLGKRGWRTYEWLSAHPGTHRQADIARATGLSPATVSRATADLIEVGLAHRDGQRGITGLPADDERLDAIAAGLGSKGRARGMREYFGWDVDGPVRAPEQATCPYEHNTCEVCPQTANDGRSLGKHRQPWMRGATAAAEAARADLEEVEDGLLEG